MSTAKVLVIGAWDQGPGYPRARALIASLRAHGVRVREENCRAAVAGARRRSLAKSPWRWPAWWLASRRQRKELRARLRTALSDFGPDAVLLPYPGHLLVRALRAVYDGPLVLDLFLSTHGTVIEDRGMFRPGSLVARMLDRLDRRACAAADLVLMDTAAHASWLRQRLDLDPERVAWVPVSDPDESALVPSSIEPDANGPLRVLFYGTGIPLHGLEVLVDAVVACPRVHLTLIGGGETDRRRAVDLCGDRLELLPAFVDAAALRKQIAAAECVAGIFGTSTKASMVLPFKVMHALSLGRPVVTRDSPAARQFLRPGLDCALCPPGDSRALVAVLDQLADRRDRLAAMGEAARQTYVQHFSLSSSGAHLCDALEALCGEPFRSVSSHAATPQIVEMRR